MRLGTETRIYELDCPGLGNYEITNDLGRMAKATLIEDLLEK